ncbi:cysteine hydrolase family protein [Virgibacillus sp. W0181]|uniref:cysteine hydrolase family protein n=1 Tax=Virgibacillus sp. W0181 TaxID=3391581 RepID=UPI003F474319
MNKLKHLYGNRHHTPEIRKDETAVIITDMQYFDTKRGFGILAEMIKDDDILSYYYDRIEQMIIPSIQKLLQFCRQNGVEVIYSKIESLTADGRDRSLSHKRLNIHVKKGTKEAEIIDEIAPKDNEIVLSKTASGVFGTTNIDYILKNLGIKNVIVTGVLTNECVENCVRSAADHGYDVYIPEETVGALTEELHEYSLTTLGNAYATVTDVDELLRRFNMDNIGSDVLK